MQKFRIYIFGAIHYVTVDFNMLTDYQELS